MQSEHMKDKMFNGSTRRLGRTVRMVLALTAMTTGLLFGGQRANAQETTIATTETTVVANGGATDTTLVPDAAMTADSTIVATADAADDSTPVGGLDSGFGGTASKSDSNHGGGLFAAAAGLTLLSALAIRKTSKRSSGRGANRHLD
jgi:hypothetical protein